VFDLRELLDRDVPIQYGLDRTLSNEQLVSLLLGVPCLLVRLWDSPLDWAFDPCLLLSAVLPGVQWRVCCLNMGSGE